MSFADRAKDTAYKNQYAAAKYDRVIVQVIKGGKERIKARAAEQGESINGYINRLIKQDMSE